MNKISVSFIITAFVCVIALVTFYVFIANGIIYFLVRNKRNHESLFSLAKKTFVKLPFLLTGYGFLAGVIIYVGVTLIDALFGTTGHPGIPRSREQISGPEVGLVVFTCLGFCISVGVGWTAFFKAYQALDSSVSDESRK
ncbi:MAG TPA: hypothetical protein VNU95_05115 [Candidatus Acidoferrales bacterium]|jgi:hypothetical protein|nr:hypothetical protein [Candidatus Acidoferrales bacterium]